MEYTQQPAYGSGGDYGNDDLSESVAHAQRHRGGDGNDEDRSLFSNAISFLQGRRSEYASPENTQIDQAQMVQSHQALYGGGGSSQQTHDSSSLGAGAALQALKMFTSGSGGGSQNELIGMAMAQAGKLWDEKQGQGAVVSGFYFLPSPTPLIIKRA